MTRDLLPLAASYPPKRPLPRSILFLCGQNAIRSPMAEVLARHLLPASIFVASAGVRTGERDPFVDAVLAEAGLSLGQRQPHRLDDLDDIYFDLMITLTPEAHHKALELTRSLSVEIDYWPTLDPTSVSGKREQIMEAYRAVRDHLAACIASSFGETVPRLGDE